MIVNCPACEKKFHIDDKLIQQNPAPKLKCSACKHVWVYQEQPSVVIKEDLPQEPKIESPRVAKIPQETAVVQKPPKSIRALWSLYLLITLLVTVPLLILLRYHVVEILPQIEPFYEALGLPVHTRTEYFSFENVRFAKQTTEEGDKLIIRGQIKYAPTQLEAQAVPSVLVTVYGKADCEKQSWWDKKRFGMDPFLEKGLCKIDSWAFSTKDNLALPGEVIKFEKEKTYKKETILPAEVNLQFVDRVDTV